MREGLKTRILHLMRDVQRLVGNRCISFYMIERVYRVV
jgi:hypothetical protein